MNLLGILLLIIITGICGAIAEFVVGYSPGGLLLSIIVGVIGAYFGNVFGEWIYQITSLRFFSVQVGNITIDIVWAIVGSIVFLLLLSLLRIGRRNILRSV
ncbi:MAG: hypothetical protein GFH27_549349n47 [Chloroflexi bacterium AL-W]|nr:hypothetical protein [Chloroflexi bacterium AL-N1]NOK69945.1 hypothetical protein [Chloroflexi bacterium AL-N10]NOK73758.1 hypothetical protein [Chloroflexi bacterium AL-N5]NOK85477.1 hypothetical protein [Chloroflexi bacterium AL-W]NOK91678.1 hypothetical protein [Chloroflexi bacterium AL-N15]